MESNLTLLSHLKAEAVKECLQKRYENRVYYTWAGPTLVAINPIREVSEMYCVDIMEQFAAGVQACTTPHIFAIGERALSHLKWNLEKSHQAIIVNGESGAGKTCSTRHLLSYLAHREHGAGHHEQKNTFHDIESLVCMSNPLLESLGNAATVRNHNSSRFGKLIRLFYSGEGEYTRLEKASIETYLLESTRVSKQAPHERNFHIFYQMLAGLPDSALQELNLKSASWKIASADGTPRDRDLFAETVKAMEMLGLKDVQLSLWKLLAALLHLGNVEFCEEEAVRVKDETRDHLRTAAESLGLDADELLSVLTVKSFTAGKTLVQRGCGTAAECEARRDTFLKLLYRLAFDFVLRVVNSQLQGSDSAQKKNYKHLCILDLYGFESFEHGNSLEQLCINYANERLQSFFTVNYLNEQLVSLTQEGIQVNGVDLQLKNKQMVISAMDGPVSVFGVLNEECYLNRGLSDHQICQRIVETLSNGPNDQHLNSPALKSPRFPRSKNLLLEFAVQHYAGHVTYSTPGMVEKNRDHIPAEFIEMLSGSRNDFITKLVKEEVSTLTRNAKTGRKHTVLAKFKNSLDNLISTLNSCNAHYVRCVRPNSNSEGEHWEDIYVEMQLNACGVLDTIRLSSFGFPLRMKMAEFVARYELLLRGTKESEGTTSGGDVCREIVREFPVLHDEIQVGKELVYLTENGFELFEKLKFFKLNTAAKKIQTLWSSYRRRKAADKLQSWWRKKSAVLKIKRHARDLAISVRTVKRALKRWILERKRKMNTNNDEMNSVNSISSIDVTTSGDITDATTNDLLQRSEAINEKPAKVRAVAVVPPTTRPCAPVPVSSLYTSFTKSKFPLTYSLSGFVTLQLPRRILFYRDGVVTPRFIPQVKLRLSIHKKCLKYSSTFPRSLLPQGLTDAL